MEPFTVSDLKQKNLAVSFVQAGVGGGLRKNIFHNGTFYRKRFGTYKKFGSIFVRAGRAAGLRVAKTIFCRSPQWNLLP